MILLFLIWQATDEKYKVEMLHVYMVDYLQNVCAHRYQKAARQEMRGDKEEVQSAQQVDCLLYTSFHAGKLLNETDSNADGNRLERADGTAEITAEGVCYRGGNIG